MAKKQAKKKATRAGRGKVADSKVAWMLLHSREMDGSKPIPGGPHLLPFSGVYRTRAEAKAQCSPWNTVVKVRITPIPPKRRAAR